MAQASISVNAGVQGKIVQCIGAVVDVEFPRDRMPKIYDALKMDGSLPQSPDQAIEPLAQLLERMAVRLGPEQVRVGCLQEDHRPEMMQRWQAWPGVASRPARAPGYPQPSWLLDPPLRLASSRHDQPEYQGPLQLIAGPQRIEGGWWQAGTDALESRHVQRDYFLYRSARAGLLWVFQQRLSAAEHGWYLHGVCG